jgi:hypothetical protein
MIILGKCPNSDSLQFFNPVNGTILSSIDYKFQPNVTSRTWFGYKYQAGMCIYRLDETTNMHAPTFPLDSTVLVHTHSPPHVATIMGTPSYTRLDIYTVQFKDNSIAEYSIQDDILEAAPMSSPLSNISLLPDWVKGGATATLFLSNMSKPRHGHLYQNESNEWILCTGNNKDLTKGILLPDLAAQYQTLLDTSQLFCGHSKFTKVYQARNQLHLCDSVLRHVSEKRIGIINCSHFIKTEFQNVT